MSYTIPDFGPADLLTSAIENRRRLKTSAESSKAAAAIDQRLFSIVASASVPAGEKLALNITPYAESILHDITVNQGLPVWVYNSHATGTGDGIFAAENLKLSSVDETPTTSQLFLNASPVGSPLLFGQSGIMPNIIFDFLDTPCIVAQNDTAGALVVTISAVFEEIGERSPSVGLTASAVLAAGTEMSVYG